MKKLKRIELLLPEEHPVWEYPRGKRRAKAIELLNTGLQIERHLRRIDQKLDSIIYKVGNARPSRAEEESPGTSPSQKIRVDVNAFTAI